MVIGRLRHWLDAGEASRLQPACHCFQLYIVMTIPEKVADD